MFLAPSYLYAQDGYKYPSLRKPSSTRETSSQLRSRGHLHVLGKQSAIPKLGMLVIAFYFVYTCLSWLHNKKRAAVLRL